MPELSHLFIQVADLARSRHFYADQLGLSVLMDEGDYLRLGGGGGFHMGIEQRPPDQVGAAGIEIVIKVGDVDADYARLSAQGIVFDTAPADMPWGARHAWLKDPDGYRLSIYS